MVRRSSSGHEYGKSCGRAVFVAERNLVDGGFRIGRFSCGHVSVCVTRILGAVARGTAKDLFAPDDHRRSVSSRCERDFVFCRRTEALRRAGSATRRAGHIFWQSRRNTVRERKREFGRETKNGVCSDAYATGNSAILLRRRNWHAGRRRSRQPARLPWRLARRHEEYIFGDGADTRAAGNIFVCSDAAAFATRARGPERWAAWASLFR